MERDAWLTSLIETVYQWLREQRNLHIADAHCLADKERDTLKSYYDEKTLDMVRVATPEKISNPPFYAELVKSGNPTLDISGSAGITLIDCIVIARSSRGISLPGFPSYFTSWCMWCSTRFWARGS